MKEQVNQKRQSASSSAGKVNKRIEKFIVAFTGNLKKTGGTRQTKICFLPKIRKTS